MVTTATPKLTIPSPSMIHYRGGRAAIDPNVYPELDGFWSDLSAAYRDEVAALAELGCTYLQFDDISLAYLNDPAQREFIARQGGDPEHQHEIYIRTINGRMALRPTSMSITTHMCRGNFRSAWAAEGGYDFVAQALFGGLNVDGFFLEFDYAVRDLRAPAFVPPDKKVVLGLVTTKRGKLEDKDAIKRRIDEAAKFVPLDQLCLSPQCGFSSTLEGNTISYDEEVAKLSLISRWPPRSGANRDPERTARSAGRPRANPSRARGCPATRSRDLPGWSRVRPSWDRSPPSSCAPSCGCPRGPRHGNERRRPGDERKSSGKKGLPRCSS